MPLGTGFTIPTADPEPDNRFELNLMDFAPTLAYESVRPLARLAAETVFAGVFSPLVDLEAATDAVPAAERLWAELEIVDVRRNPVAGRVVWLIAVTMGELDDATADVPAPIPPLRRQTPGYDRLLPNAP